MTREEHQTYHRLAYAELGELVADFKYHTGSALISARVQDLLAWSFKQTISPTEIRGEALDE